MDFILSRLKKDAWHSMRANQFLGSTRTPDSLEISSEAIAEKNPSWTVPHLPTRDRLIDLEHCHRLGWLILIPALTSVTFSQYVELYEVPAPTFTGHAGSNES